MAHSVTVIGDHRPHLRPVRAGRRARRALDVGSHVLELALAAVSFTLLATLAVGAFVLHLGVSPVLTGSMEPAYGPGDAVITRMVDTGSLRPGDVAVFVPPGESRPLAHRITSVTYEQGHPVVTTRGDANPAPDAWRATLDQPQVRKVVGVIPHAGHPMTWLDTPQLRALGIGLLGLVLTGIGTAAILRAPGSRRPTTSTPTQ